MVLLRRLPPVRVNNIVIKNSRINILNNVVDFELIRYPCLSLECEVEEPQKFGSYGMYGKPYIR